MAKRQLMTCRVGRRGERPLTTENGRDFAKRLLDDKYGAGNYPNGPGSEFNKIKKWGDRAFE